MVGDSVLVAHGTVRVAPKRGPPPLWEAFFAVALAPAEKLVFPDKVSLGQRLPPGACRLSAGSGVPSRYLHRAPLSSREMQLTRIALYARLHPLPPPGRDDAAFWENVYLSLYLLNTIVACVSIRAGCGHNNPPTTRHPPLPPPGPHCRPPPAWCRL